MICGRPPDRRNVSVSLPPDRQTTRPNGASIHHHFFNMPLKSSPFKNRSISTQERNPSVDAFVSLTLHSNHSHRIFAKMAVKDDRLKGNMLVCSILACLALTSRVLPVAAFGSALFQEVPTLQQTFRSSAGEVDIELPDFDELFERIQQVSPLARSVISGNNHQKKGFEGIDDHCKSAISISSSSRTPE